MKGNYIILRDINQTLRKTVTAISGGNASPADFGSLEDSGPVVKSLKPGLPPMPKIEMLRNAGPSEVAELAGDEHVLAVAHEMPVSPIEPAEVAVADSADPGPGPTWGIINIGADKCKFSGQSATVAIIDSGIRSSHQAFRQNDASSKVNIVSQDFTGVGNVEDASGHGTHCAATIVGRDVNGRRIGVAPGVRTLLVARIFAPGVATTSQMVVNALTWAMDNGANVISMSLSFDFTGMAAGLQQSGLPPQAATAQALIEFQNNLRLFDSVMSMFRAQEDFPGKKGVVIVGAGGNFSDRVPAAGKVAYSVPVAAPCNAIGLLSVGALQPGQSGLEIAPFSNSGPTLVAPGVGVLSADFSGDGLLTLKSGTSMACPHVAGLAALWWDSVNLSGVPAKANVVATRLQASCRRDPLNPGLGADDSGVGIPCAPTS